MLCMPLAVDLSMFGSQICGLGLHAHLPEVRARASPLGRSALRLTRLWAMAVCSGYSHLVAQVRLLAHSGMYVFLCLGTFWGHPAV